mmetsp:Transcript_25819/g.40009  ORF Transcript_25819/g.40009 Transcript_25819/m.40009 type:complete len:232 (+) Transcript_25819:1079-1774(+)
MGALGSRSAGAARRRPPLPGPEHHGPSGQQPPLQTNQGPRHGEPAGRHARRHARDLPPDGFYLRGRPPLDGGRDDPERRPRPLPLAHGPGREYRGYPREPGLGGGHPRAHRRVRAPARAPRVAVAGAPAGAQWDFSVPGIDLFTRFGTVGSVPGSVSGFFGGTTTAVVHGRSEKGDESVHRDTDGMYLRHDEAEGIILWSRFSAYYCAHASTQVYPGKNWSYQQKIDGYSR